MSLQYTYFPQIVDTKLDRLGQDFHLVSWERRPQTGHFAVVGEPTTI